MLKLKVSGVAELQQAFLALDQRHQRVGLIKAVKAGNDILQPALEAAAPFDPESEHRKHLRDSMMRKFIRRGVRRVTQVVGPDKTTDDRARFAEFGTVHQTPDPFMRPTQQENAPEMIRATAETLWANTIEGMKK